MIWTTIYPETKFLYNYEPTKPNKICAFKYEKERNRKKGRGDRSQANPRSSKANSKKSLGLRIILFGSVLYSPSSLGRQCHPQGHVKSSGSTLGPGMECEVGAWGRAQDVAFFAGGEEWSCPLKQVETALPLPFPLGPRPIPPGPVVRVATLKIPEGPFFPFLERYLIFIAK